MKLIINTVTLMAMALWLAGILGVVFYLASAKDKSWSEIFIATCLILSPSAIGLIYRMKNWDFFNISSRTFSLFTTIVPLLLTILFFGMPILNKLRGVSDAGLSVKEKDVYLDGKVIKGADSKTFKNIDQSYSIDKDHVYFRYNILTGVDPKAFSKIGSSQFFSDKKFVVYKELCLKVKKVLFFTGCSLVQELVKAKNNCNYSGPL